MHGLASWTISITVIHVLHTVIVEFGPERRLIVNSPLLYTCARGEENSHQDDKRGVDVCSYVAQSFASAQVVLGFFCLVGNRIALG